MIFVSWKRIFLSVFLVLVSTSLGNESDVCVYAKGKMGIAENEFCQVLHDNPKLNEQWQAAQVFEERLVVARITLGLGAVVSTFFAVGILSNELKTMGQVCGESEWDGNEKCRERESVGPPMVLAGGLTSLFLMSLGFHNDSLDIAMSQSEKLWQSIPLAPESSVETDAQVDTLRTGKEGNADTCNEINDRVKRFECFRLLKRGE